MSEDAGKKSCASYTAKCRLILVGGLRRDDAGSLSSSRRETEEIRGCTLHRLHTKKGLSGQQPHLHARAQQARQWSHKCSRRHPRPHSTPRTAGSERSGERACQRPQEGRFSMSCCKMKHKSEDNIANSGQNTAQIWIISTKAYTYSPRRISRANNRQKMTFSLSAEIRRGGIGRSGGSEEVSTEAERCRSGRRKAQRWQPDFQRRSSAGRSLSEAIPEMPNTRRTRHLSERLLMKVAGFCRPFGVEVADFCTLFTGFCHFGVRIMPVSRSAGAVPSTPSSLFAVQNCTKCPHSDQL